MAARDDALAPSMTLALRAAALGKTLVLLFGRTGEMFTLKPAKIKKPP